MGKRIVLYCILYLIISCKKGHDCPPKTFVSINPSFIDWTKPYPANKLGYVRFKSNKGPEESLLINRDMTFNEWRLQDDEDCSESRGEWRDYNLTSSIYTKWFQISILQYSSTQTLIEIVNRSGGMDDGGIIFSQDNSYKIQYSPCDTCLKLLHNYPLNNKLYAEVIRMYCPNGASSPGSESVKEMYLAKGYGLVQYTCSDSTVWNIVN